MQKMSPFVIVGQTSYVIGIDNGKNEVPILLLRYIYICKHKTDVSLKVGVPNQNIFVIKIESLISEENLYFFLITPVKF